MTITVEELKKEISEDIKKDQEKFEVFLFEDAIFKSRQALIAIQKLQETHYKNNKIFEAYDLFITNSCVEITNQIKDLQKDLMVHEVILGDQDIIKGTFLI